MVKKVRHGNINATLVLRLVLRPESKADLRSVKISKLAQKLTEIATFLQSGGAISNLIHPENPKKTVKSTSVTFMKSSVSKS